MISIFAVSINFLWQRQEIRLQFEWDMVKKENISYQMKIRCFLFYLLD